MHIFLELIFINKVNKVIYINQVNRVIYINKVNRVIYIYYTPIRNQANTMGFTINILF